MAIRHEYGRGVCTGVCEKKADRGGDKNEDAAKRSERISFIVR